jgi:CHAT domain-containing protein/tetratricopeptide (TPR) repeat protein
VESTLARLTRHVRHELVQSEESFGSDDSKKGIQASEIVLEGVEQVGHAEKHLTSEQIERLALGQPIGAEGQEHFEAIELARRHVLGCAACQKLVSMHSDFERRLRGLTMQENSDPGPDCPPETALWELASGGLSPGRVEMVLEHVTHCDRCGQTFRSAAATFADTTTEEEERVLASLVSGTANWQGNLAKRLAVASNSPVEAARTLHPQPFFPRMLLALTAATVVLLATVASWIAVVRRPTPEVLLARAYSQERTLELRISDAAYAPIRVERGGDRSRVDRPPELLEAEAIIGKNLRGKPNDVRWLHAKGQADLLDNSYESALSTLDRAHRLAPNDDSISVDLASAYFQVAQSTDTPDNYNRTIDLLRRVTVSDPNNAVAWFNLAISCERMHYYSRALEAWDSYLRVDPSSRWSDEARARRVGIQNRIGIYRKDRSLKVDPLDFLKLAQNEGVTGVMTLKEPVETYLDVALTVWVPQVASGDPKFGQDSAAMEALHLVANVAANQQKDRWLKDFVKDVETNTSSRSAAMSLNRAISLSGAGDYARAKTAAARAERGFARSHSNSGLMRARFETVYATHLSQQGQKCYSKAENLKKSLAGSSYTWLEIQTSLEAATCANMIGDIEEARSNANRAFQLAKEVNYDSLYLRATMELAVLDWTSGNFANATRLVNAGLDKFWTQGLPPMRGYSLYAVLDSVAEDSELWHADVTIDREATDLLNGDPDHGLLGFEYQRLANAAVHSGELSIARDYFRRSSEQFAQAPPGDALETYKAASEIGLARADCLTGNCTSARTRLQAVESRVYVASNRYVAWDFYLAQGEVLSATGESEAALQSYLNAVGIAEKGLTSVGSERERLIWMREYNRTYRAVVKLELTGDPVRAFRRWEWYKGAPVRMFRGAIVQSSRPHVASPGLTAATDVTVSNDRALLGDSVVLSFALFPNESGVWVHDARGTQYRRISVAQDQLEELVRRFSASCADVHSDPAQLRADGRRLYGLLIRPLVPLLTSKRLSIEADGILEGVPFEALITDEGRFLGDEFDIANSPGMAYLPFTRSTLTRVDIRNSLVVANPYAVGHNSSLEQLPSANDEATEVARMLPNSHLLLGSSVTSRALLEGLRNADVFHFSGHAVATKEGAALILGSMEKEDGYELLDALQLGGEELKRTRLVVLSACSTAGSEGRTLSETSSLERMFLTQGVPQVIATRWSVDSSASQELVVTFYNHLLLGIPVTEALRQARQQIRARDGYAHPYYWAGFSVFGKI